MLHQRRFLPAGLLLALALSSLAACGGPKEAEDPHVVQSAGLAPAEGSAPVIESVETPITQLERATVVRVVDAGLGRFLQGVELQAEVEEGKFRGFRIVRFVTPEDWRGVGLLVGDVITSINDMPIERPEQAHAAFVSLRTAPALEVAYLRADQPLRLSLPIVGATPESKPEKSQEKPASIKLAPAGSEDAKSDGASSKKRAPQ